MDRRVMPLIIASLLSLAAAFPSEPTASPSVTSGTETSTTPPTPGNITASNCNATDCEECLTKPGECIFVIYKDTSDLCKPSSFKPPNDPVKPSIISDQAKCSGDDPNTTDSPQPTTTSSTTSSTTTSSTTTTTTPTTTSTSTTTTTTTTKTTSTTAAPTEAPEPESRGHFDGWSFFGGILLTLGIAAIGFVGFKYYKLRSVSGANYNRF